jgi:hypothetical protein
MFMRTRSIYLTVLISPVLFAQTTISPVSFGVTAGTNLTDTFGTLRIPMQLPSAFGTELYTTGPRSFIIGPKLEIRLPLHFAIEIDALHRSLNSNIQFVSSTPGFPSSKVTAIAAKVPWEFPVLGKYRFTLAGVHPFVEAGPSFRASGTSGISHYGTTAGGGIEFHAGSLNISPALRYTHWNQSFSFPPERPDQVELLAGFDWSSPSGGPASIGRRMSFGVLAGASLGDNFHPEPNGIFTTRSDSNTVVGGVSLEVGLQRSFSAEIDGLFRPLHGNDGGTRFATLTWEFPVLAKYRFTMPKARPFVELGPSFRSSGNIEIAKPSSYGVSGGAGIEFGHRRLKVAPTIRYTRWAADNVKFTDVGHAFQNEAQVLLGISF